MRKSLSLISNNDLINLFLKTIYIYILNRVKINRYTLGYCQPEGRIEK